MLIRSTRVAVVFTILAALHTAASAQEPAEDTLKRIIEEGNPAYLDWSTALADRELIGRLYAANGYRLLWSDGEKPSPEALVLLQELRHASERGLDPEDYPGNRLAYLLVDLIDSVHPGVEQWALFDASLSLAALSFLSDLHYGRIDPASVGHNLTVDRIRLDLPTTLAHLATAVNVNVALDSLEPQFTHYALLKRELARYRELRPVSKQPPSPHGIACDIIEADGPDGKMSIFLRRSFRPGKRIVLFPR